MLNNYVESTFAFVLRTNVNKQFKKKTEKKTKKLYPWILIHNPVLIARFYIEFL